MIWWLYNSKRLESEKAALEKLEGSITWLKVGNWKFNTNFEMCVKFWVTHNEKEYGFRMIYPHMFPDVPTMIYTEDGSRISHHQYGAEGELCLEYRPDNWLPSYNGANMVESCRRLLSEERPREDIFIHAHSAHVASLGRDLLLYSHRFLIAQEDINFLNKQVACKALPLTLCWRIAASTIINSIHYIGLQGKPDMEGNLKKLNGDLERKGFAVRLPGYEIKQNITTKELKLLLDEAGLHDLWNTLYEGKNIDYLLIGNGNKWLLFEIIGEGSERRIIAFTTIEIPNEKLRLPDEFKKLAEKRIGIIGCGSLGSKVAASLCRSGVGNFLLVDDDIFFPGNIVRNELNLSATGVHKSYALKEILEDISPSADVKVFPVSLRGQVSTGLLDYTLVSLSDCDILLDATANPTAFNLIASISKRMKIPMVWSEVFSGGIGGFIARSRPNIDPVPLSVRQQIATWCNDQDEEFKRKNNLENYEGLGDDGKPLIASDAEVMIIAGYVARFISDILVRPEESIFPNSVYLIGFSSEWLFDQPFDTIPIKLQPDGEWQEVFDIQNEEQLKKTERTLS